MCGIFGQITTTPEKINDGYIKILGMDNVSRGRDSCGVFLDGEIYTGVNGEKDFGDFIKGRRFKPSVYPVVFGHTRKASSGAVTKNNAHPFGFGELDNGDYRFVGVHNGTIYNDDELAKDYGVSTTIKEHFTNSNSFFNRNKIDSQILLEILTKNTPDKDFRVLEDYDGGAALAWYDTLEPNVFYLFHGASANAYNYVTEERPLFTYWDGESLFFSSIESSLHKLGASKEEIYDLDTNVVYRITDGDIENAERFEIDRSLSIGAKPRTYGNYGGYNHTRPKKTEALPSATKGNKFNVKSWNVFNNGPIFKDINSYQGRIYEHGLRYWKNGHTINGVHIYIPQYGLYELFNKEEGAIAYSDIVARCKSLKSKIFDTHLGRFSSITEIIDKDSQFKPFMSITPLTYFYVEGVELLSLSDYNALVGNGDLFKNGDRIDVIKLSHVSRYPVTEIKTLASRKKDSPANILFYKNGNLANETRIHPQLSGFEYSFKQGVCTEMDKRNPKFLYFLGNLPAYKRMLDGTDTPVIDLNEDTLPMVDTHGVGKLMNSAFNNSEMTLCKNGIQNDNILTKALATLNKYEDVQETVEDIDVIDLYYEAADKFIDVEEIAKEIIEDVNKVPFESNEIKNIRTAAEDIVKIIQFNIK